MSDRVWAIRYRLHLWVDDWCMRDGDWRRPQWFWEWLFCATFVSMYYDDGGADREFPF
jgi:hypothetical protein